MDEELKEFFAEWRKFFHGHTERMEQIEFLLLKLLQKADLMAGTQADLDAAIAALPDQVKTSVEAALAPVIAAIIAKAKGAGVDFTPEITQLSAVGGTVGTSVAADLAPAP